MKRRLVYLVLLAAALLGRGRPRAFVPQMRGEFVSIGNREGTVEDVTIETETQEFDDIHTVTIYLGARNQQQYHDYIIGLKPQRIIFNPGAENSELSALAQKENIEVVEYCTLILLDTNTF